VGRVAQQALAAVGVQDTYIRHPSHGGKREFLLGIAALTSAHGRDLASAEQHSS
jgi:hypothetical protein